MLIPRCCSSSRTWASCLRVRSPLPAAPRCCAGIWPRATMARAISRSGGGASGAHYRHRNTAPTPPQYFARGAYRQAPNHSPARCPRITAPRRGPPTLVHQHHQPLAVHRVALLFSHLHPSPAAHPVLFFCCAIRCHRPLIACSLRQLHDLAQHGWPLGDRGSGVILLMRQRPPQLYTIK